MVLIKLSLKRLDTLSFKYCTPINATSKTISTSTNRSFGNNTNRHNTTIINAIVPILYKKLRVPSNLESILLK